MLGGVSFILLFPLVSGMLFGSLGGKMLWKQVSGQRWGHHLHLYSEVERRATYMGQKTSK